MLAPRKREMKSPRKSEREMTMLDIRLNRPFSAPSLQWLLLLALIFDLFFDGIFRRLTTGNWALACFFVKDALCMALWVACLPRLSERPRRMLMVGLSCLLVVTMPSFLLTALHDPWLAIYGLKQRILPLGVALAVVVVCSKAPAKLAVLCAVIALLLAQSGLLAVWQTLLPVGHWLNRGPGGLLLSSEHIKAGVSRVSSTFSFFAQYAYFLNLALPATLSGAALLHKKRVRYSFIVATLLGVAGAHAANSRAAVFGPLFIVGGAFCFKLSIETGGHCV